MDVFGNIGIAFLLTILAGLSTGLGGAIAYFIKKPKIIYLCFSLAFSAGVMIYISFVELLPKAIATSGQLLAITAFFLGILFIGLIDIMIPETKNPHHYKEFPDNNNVKNRKILLRTGLFTAVAIAIHNFPEGLAIFGTSLTDIRLGVIIAIAIALHNIPEGISVSVPIFYATGSKKKAFYYSFLSGLAEPAGAAIGFVIILPFISPAFLVLMLAFVAGIMVYISIDELLPMAHRYGHSHIVIFGVILGMFIMAVSLLVL